MNLYIGRYWIPFPSSEYGGTWAVIAENVDQCVDILCRTTYHGYEEYDSEVPRVVAEATCLTLDPEQNYIPGVVDYFFT